MPQPGPAPAPDWDGLRGEVRDLERRIAEIKQLLEGVGQVPDLPFIEPVPQAAAAPDAGAVLPLIGRALLGLAGAYLLRALTESAVLAPAVGVGIGILYAILWLVWAARTPAERRLATALHSLTAVLVLSPLLWEATLRFHAVSSWTAGGVLLFFTVFGLAVSWRKNLLVVATIATLAGLGTAAGLLVATHDALPFTFVFLATAAAVEISACLDHWLSERWLAATAADLSVLLAIWLVTNPRGVPEAWAPIPHGPLLAAQAALLAIYLSSIIVRTLLRGFTFTGFETAQCAAAFVIGVGGGLRLSHQAPVIGLVAMLCGAACYGVAFARLDRGGSQARNFHTYSTFGLLLLLCGSRILLPGAAAAGVWPALAVGCVWAGGFFGRLTLQVHGVVYLVLATVSTGALARAAAFLLGADATVNAEWAVWTGAATALVCCVLAARGDSRPARISCLAVAGILVWLAAGIAASGLVAGYHAVMGPAASHAYCATLRTTVLAGASLLLAWAGARWNNLEFSRLIYPVMALGAYRLLMEDMHQERKAALFLSLLVYGAALTVLPRISRKSV